MRKNLARWSSALGLATTLMISSCAYDPNYTSVGGSYSSGYDSGPSYGSSGFSTSLFVSTGDPHWRYDPSTYSYFDNRSNRFYDPYLNGYYPVNYRPPIVIGVPHPYGWRPGSGYCPPPRGVRNVTVVNYRNRESSYRNSNYSWAKRVHQAPNRSQNYERQTDRRPGSYDRSNFQRQPNPAIRGTQTRPSTRSQNNEPQFSNRSENQRTISDRSQFRGNESRVRSPERANRFPDPRAANTRTDPGVSNMRPDRTQRPDFQRPARGQRTEQPQPRVPDAAPIQRPQREPDAAPVQRPQREQRRDKIAEGLRSLGQA